MVRWGRSNSGLGATRRGRCWWVWPPRSWLGRIIWSVWIGWVWMWRVRRWCRWRGWVFRGGLGGGRAPGRGQVRDRRQTHRGGLEDPGRDQRDRLDRRDRHAGAHVAVATYCPAWWPTSTRLLIRRVALASEQISTDPRSRRRRTLHPDQRALPWDELAGTDAVYGYSFILTNLDVSTPAQAAAVEHWYRHRTTIENIFRDAKHGAALRHLPSGYVEINTAWMWGALIATSIGGWLHQLTATPDPHGPGLLGWGVREGKAMIATLRHRLIRVPARLIRHAAALILRLPPGHQLLTEILTRLRALPATS